MSLSRKEKRHLVWVGDWEFIQSIRSSAWIYKYSYLTISPLVHFLDRWRNSSLLFSVLAHFTTLRPRDLKDEWEPQRSRPLNNWDLKKDDCGVQFVMNFSLSITTTCLRVWFCHARGQVSVVLLFLMLFCLVWIPVAISATYLGTEVSQHNRLRIHEAFVYNKTVTEVPKRTSPCIQTWLARRISSL